jgi:hypothetical protein
MRALGQIGPGQRRVGLKLAQDAAVGIVRA